MDAMALLCTLHGDGPATLRLLRQAGLSTLEVVGTAEPEAIARALDCTPAAARRLRREARSLFERLGGEAAAAEPPAPASASAPRLEAREQRILERVLDVWRGRDEREPVSADTGPAAVVGALAEEVLADLDVERSDALVPGRLDGLDEALCLALMQSGCKTLEELAGSEPLDLAHEAGLAFSKVFRLRGLARRALDEADTPPVRAAVRTAAREGERPFSLSERATFEPPLEAAIEADLRT